MRLHILAMIGLLAAGPVAAQLCNPDLPHDLPTGRFQVQTEGTITDVATGLTWMRCPVGQNWRNRSCEPARAVYVMHDWDDAMAAPRSRRLQRFGLDQWRIPTREELFTLVESACTEPATNLELFPNTEPAWFWTASETGGGNAFAWSINFADGSQQAELKVTSSSQVRLVRGTFTPLPPKPLPFVETPASRPFDDGIHDPDLTAIEVLQRPEEALASFPRTASGRVDWVVALQMGMIDPRVNLEGGGEMTELDFTIVMPRTKDMPYVRFPHKEHTQWLECSNCHPAIFTPKLGSNPITMGGILQGKHCGECHGRVAFSVYECERCHNVMHKDSPERWW